MDKEEEVVRKNLEASEFNNYKEDLQIIKEEKQKEEKKNNYILIMAGVASAIIVGILLIIILKDLSKNKQTLQEEPATSKTTLPGKFSSFGTNQGKLLYGEYVKDSAVDYVVDFKGNAYTLEDLYRRVNNSPTDIKMEKNAVTATKWNGTKVATIFSKKLDLNYTGILVGQNSQEPLGIYENKCLGNGKCKLFIFENNSYKEINMGNNSVDTGEKTQTVYMEQYIITKNKKDSTYGIYDLKNQQMIVASKYDMIKYLNGDHYLAEKKGKAGIINLAGETIVDFQYTLLEKRGNYYIVSVDDQYLKVLDSDAHEVKDSILAAKNLGSYSYQKENNPLISFYFEKHLIIGIDSSVYGKKDYYQLTSTGFANIAKEADEAGVVDSFFVIKTGNTFTFYDKNIQKAKEVKINENEIKIADLRLFLNNYLAVAKSSNSYNFYDLSTGTSNTFNSFYRDHGDYEVRFTTTNGDKGTVTIKNKKAEQVVGQLENASLWAYLSAPNNGVSLRENVILYDTSNYQKEGTGIGDILMVPRN